MRTDRRDSHFADIKSQSGAKDGVLIVNDPQGLRDLNELAPCGSAMPPETLVSRVAPAKAFVESHGEAS